MIRKYLEKLCKELAISTPELNVEKAFPLTIGDVPMFVRDLDPGVALQANIRQVPKKKKEELFIFLSRANLLGQGTGATRIGLSQDEKSLTLSLGLPYEMNYQLFKEAVEDFVNYLQYFKEEVTKFENTESVY